MTARLRLTLLLSGLFIAAGAILLVLNYSLVCYRMTAPSVISIDTTNGIIDNTMGFSVAVPVDIIPPDPNNGALVDLVVPLSPTLPDDFTNTYTIAIPAEPAPAVVLQQLEWFEDQIISASLRELMLQSSIALMIISALVVYFSWFLAGKVLRPVQEITMVARNLSEQRLHERINLSGPNDELKRLADTFDTMLDRLEQAFASERRFASNASHELRTPLTIMRTEIEVTLADPQASVAELRQMGHTINRAIERSEHLIDSLLVLARSQQIIEKPDLIDLADLTAYSIDQYAAQAATQAIIIDTRLESGLVQGHQTLLERLVANLIENAIRYNHRHGWIWIETIRSGNSMVLIVENSGQSIADAAIEPLFQPFRRMGNERTAAQHGAGLGLSIVRSIADSHAGCVHAVAGRAGGLRVEVRLPYAEQASAYTTNTIRLGEEAVHSATPR
ncbi:MAG: ATP-binding protein [Roseiflexaceae bacterium]